VSAFADRAIEIPSHTAREDERARLGCAVLAGDDAADWRYGYVRDDAGEITLARTGRRSNVPLPDPFRHVISAIRGCRHAGDGLVIDGCPSCARRARCRARER